MFFVVVCMVWRLILPDPPFRKPDHHQQFGGPPSVTVPRGTVFSALMRHIDKQMPKLPGAQMFLCYFILFNL